MAGEPPENASTAPAAPPMRVLHVADCDIVVRFGRMLRHLALALGAEGVRVSLLTDDPVAIADLEGTPVECHGYRHLSGWLAWRLPQQLSRRLDPLPQVVHLWGTACLRSVGEWALRNAVPLLVHALSARDIDRLVQRGPRPGLSLAAGCAGLVRMCRERSRAMAEQFTVLRPAFLMPDQPDVDRTPAAERTLGIIWAGRMDEDAGLDTLVDAVAQLRSKNVDLQTALVGTGPGEPALRDRIRHAQVQDSFSIIDEPRLWDKAVRGADVCVVPACQHELGLAPLLALALGKVVLCSRDQTAEWFIEDRTVWQFAPGAAVELAYHLTRVAEGHRQAGELARSAAAYVREHHVLSRFVEGLITMYRAAIEAKDSSPPTPIRVAGSDSP